MKCYNLRKNNKFTSCVADIVNVIYMLVITGNYLSFVLIGNVIRKGQITNILNI